MDKQERDRQKKAKAAQGHVEKALPETCGSCRYFIFEEKTVDVRGGNIYRREFNLWCTLGSFATKKRSTCLRWKAQ